MVILSHINFFLNTCMGIGRACVFHTHVTPTKKPEEGARRPWTRLTDSCEPPGGYWKLNPSLIEEQLVPLTSAICPAPKVKRLHTHICTYTCPLPSYGPVLTICSQ